MRLLLIISASALVLAGCAGDFDKSAEACKRPPDQQAQWELVTSGVVSLGMDMPTKKRLGIVGPNYPSTNAACDHNGDDKGKPQQVHDLQKVGVALSPDSRS